MKGDAPAEIRDVLPVGVIRDNDLGNAHRLHRLFGDDLCYVSRLGWYIWDKRRWHEDHTGEVHRRIHRMARAIEGLAVELFAEASKATAEDERKRLQNEAQMYLSWARKSQSEARIRACAEVARTLEEIAITSEVLDTDPLLLTTLGGTLEGKGLQLREHRREDRITKLANASCDRNAKAPTWDSFLDRILPDRAVRDFLQRAIGYSLTGETGEQCMFVCHGMGANGKSTLLETFRYVLGDYAVHVQADTLMAIGRGRGADNDLMRLRGARFVTAIETGEDKRLDEPRIKSLTGGDTVTARLLYREPVEFKPVAKIWLATNHRPEVTGTDDAIWRRLRLIPFEVQIPEAERDHGLAARLRAEANGILAWMIRGCLQWRKHGLRPPEAVLAATSEWRADSDEVARFVGECCEVIESVRVQSGHLYASYAEWARAQGNREPLTRTAFGRRLTESGFVESRTSNARYRKGIGLLQTTGDGQ